MFSAERNCTRGDNQNPLGKTKTKQKKKITKKVY
jgi:hypothetical protein